MLHTPKSRSFVLFKIPLNSAFISLLYSYSCSSLAANPYYYWPGHL